MPCNKGSAADEEDKLYTKQFLKVTKLLLLGTGESGKTTIIKQMKILHISGFTNEEKKEKIPPIKQNIHESIYDILDNMDKIEPPTSIQNEENRASAEYILKIGKKEPAEFTEEYYDHVKKAWNDEGVQETFKRSNEFQLIDCAKHFLDRIDEIRKPDYIPTLEDILYCRVMTVAISKIEFEVPVPKNLGGGTAEFWMYDVGGQRGHRKKWTQVFSEAIKAILFLIAASDFDLNLREDPSQNRLKDAFELFQFIYSNKFLYDSGLIVFLNKQDTFKKKIEDGHKLEKYFPDFKNYVPAEKDCNTSSEYERAKYWMKQKIMDIASKPVVIEEIFLGKIQKQTLPKRDVYVHFTVATDTGNIKRVFESVQEIILIETLKDTALY